MQATVELSQFKLNAGGYSKTLDEVIRRQMRVAGTRFLKVAMQAVPVRTGFARGSFGNLAEATKSPANIYLAISKVLRRQKKASGQRTPIEYYRDGGNRILKTPQAGRAYGTPVEQIFQVVSGVYTFDFNVLISYFDVNDPEPGTSRVISSPWESFEHGRAAFADYMETVALDRLPKVDSFVMESTISVNGTVIGQTSFDTIKRE